MTKKYQLGRLEKVDLREVWANEARDFTPWLAREENMALLSEAIGMELEVEESEKSVGSYAADIVCREAKTGHRACIATQFDETDNKHLGKIMTHAAKMNATTIIWITRKFNDEHRTALNWLNYNTTKNIGFIGVEIELYRIDNSPIAPHFKIVSQSNEWTRTTRQVSDLNTTRLEYWTIFCDLVEMRGGLVKPAKPRNRWIRHSILSNFKLDMGYDSKQQTLHINVSLTGPSRTRMVDALAQEKAVIEREVNGKLDWRRSSGTIYLRKPRCDIFNKDSWAEQHEWLYGKLQVFYKVFTERIKNL